MEVKRNRFFKILSLVVGSLLLTVTICSAATTSSAYQRFKSYDELKQIYMNIVASNADVDVIEEEVALDAAAPSAAYASRSGSGSDSVSSTNVQVAGVDEGDIVKTDGNYIYAISNVYDNYVNYSKVNIISTLRKGNMQVVGSIKVTGSPLELYLKGNKLTLIVNQDMYLDLNTNKYLTIAEYQKISSDYQKNYKTNTGAMNDAFYNRYMYKSMVAALVYDISNPAQPKNIRNVKQDGYYLSSRLIGDQLYMVTNSSSYWIRYAKSDDININAIVPQYSDTAFGITNKILLPQSICMFPNVNYYSFTVVSGFNINANTQVTCEATLGGGSNIYASQNSLYVMSEHYNNAGASARIMMPTSSNTNILKYSLSNGVPKVSAFGSVPGRILNQFSVDEYNGNFRVATTTGNTWGEGTTNNNVYVLNSSLKVVGKIENLAPGERIYSVRFMDKKGYVVTFKEVDPLFALDLSNPQAPKVTGQLKIPGFSNYLHPYSENILIGIGNNTVESVAGALTNGLKLSLFDVSNPFAPKEIQSYTLGSRGTYSEVLYNHKALMFSKEKNIMGFPVQLYETTKASEYGTLTNIGFYLFKIDPKSGFSLLGNVTHLNAGTNPNNAWSSGLVINRGVYVDNTLYTISDKLVKANSLNNLKLIQQVNLP